MKETDKAEQSAPQAPRRRKGFGWHPWHKFREWSVRHPLVSRIDRYIIAKFLGTYIFLIALIISIAVIFDFMSVLTSSHRATFRRRKSFSTTILISSPIFPIFSVRSSRS